MTGTSPDPSDSPISLHGANEEESIEIPMSNQAKATACMEFNSTMRDAALDLVGVPSNMRPGAAKLTETPVTATGPDGFVYTYFPSDFEKAKQLSDDELVAGITRMSEELKKYSEFNAEAGAILADFLQDYGRLTMESS